MFKISEQWHCQEFEKENQSQGFWFSHTDDEEGISFLAGAGTDLHKITPEMCDLVAQWMYTQNARISISSTFQEMYEQAVRVQAEDEPLWIESDNGVMDIPYTVEQLGKMFVEKAPPPSLL